ncbi:hypothetical protein B0G84_5006 [Paraburkholderia sp. BL8N3]|nr:hypothetical protein B0G84_5006 [Paraburkholderia sp. BL8N3]
MIFHWPQIVMTVLIAMNLGLSLAMYGKPRRLYSAWWSLFDAALLVWILVSGGFFGATA